MTTDYNNFAKTFSKSRKNMKWEELEYFFLRLEQGSVLDIGCGSGRFIEQYREYFGSDIENYFGFDMSEGLIEEAKEFFPDKDFRVGNMLNIQDTIGEKKYQNIFLIASFHHLETLGEREKMIKILFNICEDGGKVYMTNWALESSVHIDKYKDSKIKGSENKYGSSDFNIKFGDHDRFYHNFDMSELADLAKQVGFTIVENRVFQGDRNIITILQK